MHPDDVVPIKQVCLLVPGEHTERFCRTFKPLKRLWRQSDIQHPTVD